MSLHLRVPWSPLDRVVDHLWVFEQHQVPTTRGILFADGCADLMLNLGEPIRLHHRDGTASRWTGAWVSGLRSAPIRIELESSRFTIVGARLRPAGLAAVLGAPAAEVTDDIVALSAFWSGVHELVGRTADAASPQQRLDALALAIGCRVRQSEMPPDDVAAAAEQLVRAPAQVIGDVRDRLGISHKHLTRLFRAHVGLPPKTFQRICRFRRLLSMLAAEAASWAELALACGYNDQSHLCREFREFTGFAPTGCPAPSAAAPDYLPVAAPESPAGALRFSGCAARR